LKILYGEFDPGSGRTLAACLRNASRAGMLRIQVAGCRAQDAGDCLLRTAECLLNAEQTSGERSRNT